MSAFLMTNAELSKFSRNYMRLKKDLPIRPSEMGVLNIIVQTEGPHTAVMLADKLGVSKPMITAHITALTKAGYVTRQPSPADGRCAFILPTEKAQMLVASAQEETDRQLAALRDALGPQDFDMLVTLITRANQVMEEHENGLE